MRVSPITGRKGWHLARPGKGHKAASWHSRDEAERVAIGRYGFNEGQSKVDLARYRR